MTHSRSRVIIIFILLIFFVVLIWRSPQFEGFFFDLVALFKKNVEQSPVLAIIVFVGLNALSAMFAPLSSVPLAPFAIAAWGEAAALLFFMAGWMIGGTLTYILGWYAAHPFLKQLSIYRRIEYYRNRISSRSQFLFVIFFRAASPAEIPGYVLGSLRYSFWRYLTATFITELPIGLITVYASRALLERNVWAFFYITLFAVAALAVLFFFFHKNLLGKK